MNRPIITVVVVLASVILTACGGSSGGGNSYSPGASSGAADSPSNNSTSSAPLPSAGPGETPPNFKVAFIGDQGAKGSSRAVLLLIKNEGAQMIIHSGDFDYNSDPSQWDSQITDALGASFPYFASVGNHDVSKWAGYQQKLLQRLGRVNGASCTGDYGVNAACSYGGLFFILSGAGTLGSGHADFIKNNLAQDSFDLAHLLLA